MNDTSKTPVSPALIDGASIDIIAMPGAIALRLRENPAEPIFYFTLPLAAKFAKDFAEMADAAAMLACNTQTL